MLDEGGETIIHSSILDPTALPRALSPWRPAFLPDEIRLREATGVRMPGVPTDPWRLPTPFPVGLPGRVEGRGVFRLPLGPVRGGVVESGFFLLEVTGEDIHHMTFRLNLKSRGVEELARTMGVAEGVISGTSGVAHSLAFLQAVEQAAHIPVPPRGQALRIVLSELERLTAHTSDLARTCQATGLSLAEAELWILVERLRRLAAALTGSRFFWGLAVVGGVHREPEALDGLGEFLSRFEKEFFPVAYLALATPSHHDRLAGTAILRPEVALAHGARGPVARAAGIATDRRQDAAAGYGDLLPRLCLADGGDALARTRVRMDEVAESLRLLRRQLAALPPGPLRREWTLPAEGLRPLGGPPRGDHPPGPPGGGPPAPSGRGFPLRRQCPGFVRHRTGQYPDRFPHHRGQFRPVLRRGQPVTAREVPLCSGPSVAWAVTGSPSPSRRLRRCPVSGAGSRWQGNRQPTAGRKRSAGCRCSGSGATRGKETSRQ